VMLAAPSKIVCVGQDYAAHARELGNDLPSEPVLFRKEPQFLEVGDVVELGVEGIGAIRQEIVGVGE